MTSKLEEVFNLESIEMEVTKKIDLPDKTTNKIEDNIEAVNTLDKIDSALPIVTGLEGSDKELDEIADLATDTFKDFRDFAMNSDPRVAAQVMQAASSLLGHAVAAKIAKVDKKLKMIDLQLKKEKLDSQLKKGEEGEKEVNGTAMDRNAILHEISLIKKNT